MNIILLRFWSLDYVENDGGKKLTKESIDKINELASELAKVQISRNAQTLLKALERISSLGEEYSSELTKSGNLQLASDVQEKVALAYDEASKKIDSEKNK